MIKRLCIARRHVRLANLLIYSCVGLGALSLFIIGIRQRAADPWNGEPSTARSTVSFTSVSSKIQPADTNPHLQLNRWIVVESFACMIDLAISIVPFALVWGLQMKRGHKVWVILGFTARLPTIPLAILRLISLSNSLASTELVFDYAMTEALTQGELCFSVISATIPCLRIFMQSAKTGLLGMSTFDSSGDRSKTGYLGSRSGTFGRTTSRSLDKLKGKRKADTREEADTIELQDRSFGQTHTSAVAGSDNQSVASDCSERAIIVRQTVDVVYT